MSLALRPGASQSGRFMDTTAHYNRRAKGLLVAATGNHGLDTSPTTVEVVSR
jgi:hypothetical protein